jgi:TatD DNase family protein
MSWVDTGVNLLDPRFILNEVLARAAQSDVQHILVIASTISEAQEAVDLCNTQQKAANKTLHSQQGDVGAAHTGLDFNNTSLRDIAAQDTLEAQAKQITLACTAGIHPHYADQASQESWVNLNTLIANEHVSAIGECGLDFNRNFSTKANQLYVFEQQLNIAATNNMGVYLHERDAFDEQMRLLEEYAGSLKFMVAHCFTGNKEQIEAYVSLGCYIGITGWLCDDKRGQDLQNAVHSLPLSKLLLETDAPYLFPKTLKPRKSKNEPCYLPHIAQKLSSILNKDISTIERYAYRNALSLFFTKTK